MATKRLHSMIFPGLADSYTVPQQTTELSDFDNFVKAGLAIISNGNTHLDIPADMYVYVYNHNTLDNGLYQNISGATIPVGATLTTSNVSQVTGGGLNVLKNTLNQLIQESAFEIVEENGEFKLYWYGAQGECPYTIVYENGVYNLYFNYTTA